VARGRTSFGSLDTVVSRPCRKSQAQMADTPACDQMTLLACVRSNSYTSSHTSRALQYACMHCSNSAETASLATGLLLKCRYLFTGKIALVSWGWASWTSCRPIGGSSPSNHGITPMGLGSRTVATQHQKSLQKRKKRVHIYKVHFLLPSIAGLLALPSIFPFHANSPNFSSVRSPTHQQ
jgi:hypothetical protein